MILASSFALSLALIVLALLDTERWVEAQLQRIEKLTHNRNRNEELLDNAR